MLPQRYGAVLLHDHLGVAADGHQPRPELLGVAHRRRQGGHLHVVRQVDDHLFPDRAPLAVGQVVHLVHDDVGEPAQAVRAAVGAARASAGVQHVAQHLGGHHDDVGVAVDRVVAGEQPDPVGAVTGDEIGVLLVRQSLDRGGVEALAALAEGQVDGELADDGLARAGRCGHEHPAAGLEGGAGGALEGVEAERVADRELGESGAGLGASEIGVALRG